MPNYLTGRQFDLVAASFRIGEPAHISAHEDAIDVTAFAAPSCWDHVTRIKQWTRDMVDPFTWTDLFRWLTTLGRRALPNRVLRLAWSRERLLASVELFHFSQAPQFYLSPDRGHPELLGIGFNVFNFTPFKLVIVGVQLRVSIDSRDLFIHEQRFPAEAPVPPHSRGGFFIRPTLSEAQAVRVRVYPAEWARVRVDGAMIVRTPYGELRKESMADVVALIDRGTHNLLPHTSAPG